MRDAMADRRYRDGRDRQARLNELYRQHCRKPCETCGGELELVVDVRGVEVHCVRCGAEKEVA